MNVDESTVGGEGNVVRGGTGSEDVVPWETRRAENHGNCLDRFTRVTAPPVFWNAAGPTKSPLPHPRIWVCANRKAAYGWLLRGEARGGTRCPPMNVSPPPPETVWMTAATIPELRPG